jgi:aminocarboxymuconate-semialdehyde decarboxylase
MIGEGNNVRTIDTHTHWFPPEWVELVAREGGGNGAKIGKNERGHMTLSVPGIVQVFQTDKSYMDLGLRIREMDESGVDLQVLSLTQPMVYWAPPDFGLKLSQVFNDQCSAAHLKYPDRLIAIATAPMQAPELAVQEIERASRLPGLRGLGMATEINGRNLDDKSFFPVYAKCEELGWPIFLHPINPVGAERMKPYYFLRNFLGNPYEEGIAAATLVFGGVLDAFPKLEVMLPHAGGAFPWLTGRMDHGASMRPDIRRMIRHPPSSYARRFYYDTVTHSDSILMNLIRHVGADRILMGSDFPTYMGYERPVDVVERLAGLSEGDRRMILRDNAVRLLRL